MVRIPVWMTIFSYIYHFQDASFSENFYGLKRRRRPWIETDRAHAAVGGIPPWEKLRSRQVWRSLVFLVGVSTTAAGYFGLMYS